MQSCTFTLPDKEDWTLEAILLRIYEFYSGNPTKIEQELLLGTDNKYAAELRDVWAEHDSDRLTFTRAHFMVSFVVLVAQSPRAS